VRVGECTPRRACMHQNDGHVDVVSVLGSGAGGCTPRRTCMRLNDRHANVGSELGSGAGALQGHMSVSQLHTHISTNDHNRARTHPRVSLAGAHRA